MQSITSPLFRHQLKFAKRWGVPSMVSPPSASCGLTVSLSPHPITAAPPGRRTIFFFGSESIKHLSEAAD